MTDEEQPATTSRSLLRPANQKPTVCYCKPGECSAPKPEWRIGRRYADGFCEAGAEPTVIKTTGYNMEGDGGPCMGLAQSDAEPQDILTTVRKRIELVINEIVDAESIAMLRTAMGELDLALAQSDAEPIYFHRYENTSRWIECPLYEYEAAKKLRNNETRVLYTAPPRPDYELSAIAAAIGSSRFMDPPDGGDVSLAEQVCRIREALGKAEAALAEPVGVLLNAAGFKEIVTRDTAAIYDNNPQPRLVEEIFDFDRKLIGFRVYDGPPRHDAEPTHRDMAYFGASEAAGYHYPGEDQQLLRDAYCRGAAEYAPRPDAQSDAEPVAWREVLDEGLFDLVELAREKRGEQWLHPGGALVGEFGNRIASLVAPPRPDASEIEQLKAELRNTWQRLETTLASEKGWEKRCQFVEAERDDARASRSPDTSAGLIEAAEIAEQVMAEDKANTRYEAGLRTMAILTAKDIAARIRARAANKRGKP